jgi:curved DNA-binding protein CbpA
MSHYEVLQVSPRATRVVINAAYRALARSCHPDVNHSTDAARLMRQINAAHAVLMDPQRRAAYDARYARLTRLRGDLRDVRSHEASSPERVAPTALSRLVGEITGSLSCCPRLGFLDDSTNHFPRPTQLHRCFVAAPTARVTNTEQREFCLSGAFVRCPRWIERGSGHRPFQGRVYRNSRSGGASRQQPPRGTERMTARTTSDATEYYYQLPHRTAAIQPAVAVVLVAGFVAMIVLVATLVVSTLEGTPGDSSIGGLESRPAAGGYARYESSTSLATKFDTDPYFQSLASCTSWYLFSRVFC